jgi:septum formation topological specificity factor MinE
VVRRVIQVKKPRTAIEQIARERFRITVASRRKDSSPEVLDDIQERAS